jgi:starch-binding outer membrane protein, SusD/RagB family
MKYSHKILFALPALSLFSCSKLDEEFRSSLTEDQAQTVLQQTTDVNVLLQSVYNGLRTYQSNEQVFALQQNTSDETLVPTRGGDWDDNGVWRVLTSHGWTPTRSQRRFKCLQQFAWDSV